MLNTIYSEENKIFKDSVRKFAETEIWPNLKEWEKEKAYPPEYYKRLAEIGIMGLLVPEEYGGSGGNLIDLVIACEEMARVGASIPLTHISACCRVICNQGNDKQKEYYLPDLASGKKIGAYCQTEPEAGSDVGNMKSFAKKEKDYYLLNGRKVFISNGKIAQVFIVLAKTETNLEKPSKGISMFIVDKDTDGVEIGKSEELMGRHCSSLDEIIFENVKIPKENLLVPAGSKGFKEIMTEFNGERCGNSAFCVGFAQGAYERALKYCKERIQFGKPISEFDGLRWILAEMATKIQMGRLLVYDAVIKLEKENKVIAKEAAMAKKFCNEMSTWVCDKAIQLLGAYGYTSDYEVERFYRDVRGWSMGGGTTQICLSRIAHEILK